MKRSFYFNLNKFEECSSNCLQCESFNKCVKCLDGFYLNFKNYQENFCDRCDDNAYCRTCLLANSTNIFDFNEVFFSQTHNKDEFEFTKMNNNLSLVCVVCLNESLALNMEGKCEICSQKINNCEKCSYSNSDIRNYSRFVLENFEQNYSFIQEFLLNSFSLKCSKCASENIPMKPNFDKCGACSQECDGCLYISNNQALEDEKVWEDASSNLMCDFYLKCEAEKYFNFKYKLCMNCPKNCLKCIMKDDGSIFCQICKLGFLLSFQTSLCEKIEDQDSQIPCMNGLLIDEDNFLCQRILDRNSYRSMGHFSSSSIIMNISTPFFLTCPTCTKTFCYEEYSGRNLTNLLYDDITSLVELNLILKKENILKTCTKCLYELDSYPYCDCNDVVKDLSLFNDSDQILESNTTSYLFSKKIYFFLSDEHLFHQIYPDLIYFESYKIVFENMHYPSRISTDQGCIMCPFSFTYCVLDNIFQAGDKNNYDQTFLTTYQDKKDCSYGFQPYVQEKTCRFCPKEYGKCTSIKKQFRIYFDDSSDDNSEFTFSDLKELQEWTRSLINNPEVSYVIKSFYVSELEILVIFRKPINFLIYPGEMQSILIDLERPLTLCVECTLLIVFKGEPTNNTYTPSIILGSPITILENQIFRIENLRFEIPYFSNHQETTQIKPFFYIFCDEIYIENCSFVTSQDFYVNTKGVLITLIERDRNSEFFSECCYRQIFEMRLENTNFFLKNIEIEINIDLFQKV